jgi:hypothetical protein
MWACIVFYVYYIIHYLQFCLIKEHAWSLIFWDSDLDLSHLMLLMKIQW